MTKGRKWLRWIGRGLLVLALLLGVLIFWQWDLFQRLFLGGVKIYETTAPALPAEIERPAILVFSKTNGFRHAESIAAANALYVDLAAKNGWGHFQTENGATFSPETLARFDAVVFNNVSGDVFTPDQRAAFKSFLEQGGGFVGVHGSGGDFSYKWDWYVNDLIGAQFIGHIMDPQFQDAKVVFENRTHPAVRDLPETITRKDEWYSFDRSVRTKGYTVLGTLDEKSYSPKGMWSQDIAMGDHPVIWWHCIGKGRALYSALGHLPEAYAEPHHKALLTGAIKWALRQDGEGCAPATAPAKEATR
jgi:type 1 glutamine amidotransferase